MRRHYESLNYIDGQPNVCHHRFSRTAGEWTGVFASAAGNRFIPYEVSLTRDETVRLRDMLNEVLADWK